MSYFKTQVSWAGASIFIPHAPQAHRAASTEDIPGPDPHLGREFWKMYSNKCFEQKDIVR